MPVTYAIRALGGTVIFNLTSTSALASSRVTVASFRSGISGVEFRDGRSAASFRDGRSGATFRSGIIQVVGR